jgi:biotin transport system substrate-specific component
MFGNLEKSRTIAYSAAFIGLITLGGWVSVPLGSIPFTLQTLFVLLSGTVMRRKAVIPVTAYILLGALGLPVFHNGTSGLGVILGPTGGYMIGFIFAALFVGLTYEHASSVIRIAGLTAATLAIYLCGVAWIVYSTGLAIPIAVAAGVLPFVPGDIIKAGAAYLIARRLP